jgi:uncharacterized LabA/DUF88 family protein
MNVAVYFDVSDLYHNVGRKFGKKLDYKALLLRLVGSDTLYRAIAYTGQADAKPFLAYLRHVNIEPKLIDDVVVDLTLDVVRLLDKLDTVYLCSNDPRLLPLIAYVKERGVKCIIVNAGICYALRENWLEIIDADLVTSKLD